MNHADAQHSGLTPDPTKMSKTDYVNAAMHEDAHGEVLAQKEHNELAAAGDPEVGNRNPATGGVYDAAAQKGANDYKAAHPDATQDEIDAAGQQAGEDRVFKSYQDGKVTQSTIDPVTHKNETYNDRSARPGTMRIQGNTRRARCLGALLFAALPASAAPAPTSFQERQMDDKEPLANLVEPVNAEQARLIRDPRTTVTRLPTPFLRNGLIFRLTGAGLTRSSPEPSATRGRTTRSISSPRARKLRPPHRRGECCDRDRRTASVLRVDAARGDASVR